MAGLAWLNAMWCNVIQRMLFRKISTEQSMSLTDTQLFLQQLRQCDRMVKEALGIEPEQPTTKNNVKLNFPETWRCDNCHTTNNAKRTECVNRNCESKKPDEIIDDGRDEAKKEEGPEKKSRGCCKCFKRQKKQSSDHEEEAEETKEWRFHAEEEQKKLEIEMLETKDVRRMTVGL